MKASNSSSPASSGVKVSCLGSLSTLSAQGVGVQRYLSPSYSQLLQATMSASVLPAWSSRSSNIEGTKMSSESRMSVWGALTSARPRLRAQATPLFSWSMTRTRASASA